MILRLEAGEGAGKGAQSARLKEYLGSLGVSYVATREPGGTQEGEELRKQLMSGQVPVEKELALYSEARKHSYEQVVIPALNQGLAVVQDRSWLSSYAYQIGGRGMDFSTFLELNKYFLEFEDPDDLTMILDLDPVVGLGRSTEQNVFETLDLEFHKRVSEHYLAAPEVFGDIVASQFVIVDATGSVEEVWERIKGVVSKHIGI